MTTVHNFQDSLKQSHRASDLPIWGIIYQRAFPDMVGMIDYRQNGEHQRAGIDRGVYLSNSKEILVDEKIRTKNYGDILLEYMSNDRYETPGWVCKPLRCDYIAYAILPSEMCYLLPTIQLQLAWQKQGDIWRQKYGTKPAYNEGYRTLNTPVPVKDLFVAIGAGLRVSFSQEKTQQKEEEPEYKQLTLFPERATP